MIQWFVGSLGLYALLACAVAECAYLASLEEYRNLQDNESRLRDRLEGYARLKSPDAKSDEIAAISHEVLLGTLKKVEGKSAVLTTILVFAIGIFINAAYGGSCGTEAACRYDAYGLLAAGAAALLVLPLYFAFLGIYHLDLYDMSHLCEGRRDELVDTLRRGLMQDLLNKERGYRFSRNVTAAVLLIFVAALFVDAAMLTAGAKL